MTAQPAESSEPAIPLSSVDGGNGSGTPNRVHAVEIRLTRIETELKHLATRAWVLGGVVGGMVAATAITLTVIKLFQ